MSEEQTSERLSKTSIIALIAAILSFASGAFWGLIFAGVAVFFGAIGMLKSFSNKVRGGIISFVSIGAGLLGLIAGIVKTIMYFSS